MKLRFKGTAKGVSPDSFLQLYAVVEFPSGHLAMYGRDGRRRDPALITADAAKLAFQLEDAAEHAAGQDPHGNSDARLKKTVIEILNSATNIDWVEFDPFQGE